MPTRRATCCRRRSVSRLEVGDRDRRRDVRATRCAPGAPLTTAVIDGDRRLRRRRRAGVRVRPPRRSTTSTVRSPASPRRGPTCRPARWRCGTSPACRRWPCRSGSATTACRSACRSPAPPFADERCLAVAAAYQARHRPPPSDAHLDTGGRTMKHMYEFAEHDAGHQPGPAVAARRAPPDRHGVDARRRRHRQPLAVQLLPADHRRAAARRRHVRACASSDRAAPSTPTTT